MNQIKAYMAHHKTDCPDCRVLLPHPFGARSLPDPFPTQDRQDHSLCKDHNGRYG